MLAHPKILKLARLALDLTQNEVAALAGISPRILQKLEACDQDTTFRTIRLVQQALEGKGVVFLGESESLGSGFRVPMDHLRGTWGDRDGSSDEGQSNLG
ncbi:helix-turn-helix domain-containing protein [Microvirga arabica]|uniref:helix-turn-helix domain-containing protein n=1 Tax=Microvirga arabica TaxID=1128671 RepID=UPI001939F038|nr:helix-turn-helix domain-containing protein [Microvirga arabica]MBM1170629.1 helix-turn-helix domain-containing protein [Microvirga arabica]